MKIELVNYSKKIKKEMVLKEINVAFESGKIYGIVGRNGSGKTMLFRAIAGLISPTSGKILFDNKPLKESDNVKLGILIENVGLYPEYTGFKNLQLLASIRNEIGEKKIENALEQVGLDAKDKRKYKKYSLGMKQKLAIAQAIMENPNVLLLDEPTNALDEESILKLREVIKNMAKQGAIVLLASHSSEEINALCDEIYTMSSGVLKATEE